MWRRSGGDAHLALFLERHDDALSLLKIEPEAGPRHHPGGRRAVRQKQSKDVEKADSCSRAARGSREGAGRGRRARDEVSPTPRARRHGRAMEMAAMMLRGAEARRASRGPRARSTKGSPPCRSSWTPASRARVRRLPGERPRRARPCGASARSGSGGSGGGGAGGAGRARGEARRGWESKREQCACGGERRPGQRGTGSRGGRRGAGRRRPVATPSCEKRNATDPPRPPRPSTAPSQDLTLLWPEGTRARGAPRVRARGTRWWTDRPARLFAGERGDVTYASFITADQAKLVRTRALTSWVRRFPPCGLKNGLHG